MLKTLAIVLGVFVIITRGIGALSPTRFRRLATSLAADLSFIRILGAILLVFCILLFAALGNDFSGARVVMAIFGVIWFFGGLLLVALPAQYAAMVDWFMKLSDGALRFLATLGVVFGILIVALGIACY